MGDYKETVERTLNDLRRAEKYCLNDYSRMAGNAANLIENILNENTALRRMIDNLTSAQAVMVKDFAEKLEELHETKSELQATVRDRETLQKTLAECKAERSWISVEDRLPDEDGNYIVTACDE